MKAYKGFSLIEVLVTLVLTTIGLLGMVVLQGKSLQYSHEAASRETAVMLANELVEILRAHRSDLFNKKPPAHYTYSEIVHSTDAYNSTGRIAATAADCPASGLSQTLKQEVGCWVRKASGYSQNNTAIAGSLPGVDAAFVTSHFRLCPSYELDANGISQCADAGFKGSSLLVQMAWKIKEAGVCGDDGICTYQLRVEL